MACARRLFWRAAWFLCTTPLAAMRSITLRDFSSAAAAFALSPAAIAFFTFLTAVLSWVRSETFYARRFTAWRAALRADLMLAMALIRCGKRGGF